MPEPFSHLELRYQDSQYDQKAALNAFGLLEQQGDVKLYHTWGVSPNETILPLANQRERPVLAETSMRSAAVNRPFVVRAARTGYDAAQRLVEGFSKNKWKRVGLIVTQIPYYTDIVDALKEIGAKAGVSIEVVAEVTPAEQEFKSIILRNKNKNFDAFGPLLLLNQILTFCEQANAVNFVSPMFGAHIHNSLDGMKRCMPLSDGALFPGQVVGKDFYDRYVKKYKTDLRIDSAAHSYETAKIIAKLFGNRKSHQYTTREILESLKTVKYDESSVGSFQYSDTPEGGKAIAFKEILMTYKDGKVVPY
jgi:ABC-type branched-subunit amino acid transport system substrate-binding protein